MQESIVIEACKNWIEKIVIGLGLCPFAAKPYTEGLVDFEVIGDLSYPEVLQFVVQNLEAMLDIPPIKLSNRFLIFPNYMDSFENYLDLFYSCEEALVESGWDDRLQLTSFHPRYLFDGEDPTSMSHYTNRSPYPMIHILRKEEVQRAIEAFGDTSSIYKRNIDLLIQLGVEKIKALSN